MDLEYSASDKEIDRISTRTFEYGKNGRTGEIRVC